MAYLILVRHGQSEWNLLNKFTGHTDVALTERGKEEAKLAAKLLKDITLHKAHTSDLKRAQETLDIILEETGHQHVTPIKHPAIKERDYGHFTGKNKEEVRSEIGEENFKKFRRGWEDAPPGGESLKDTAARTIPYYEEHIKKDLALGHNVIVAAHGNSLRALIKHLENISDDTIAETEIGTGVLYIYEIDDNGAVMSKQIRDHKN